MSDMLDAAADRYAELAQKKKDLEEQAKEVNKELTDARDALAQLMIDEETPRVSRHGRVLSLTDKVKYSKKSERDLAERGLDFFGALRRNGLEDLIKETVDPSTLNGAVNNMIDERQSEADVEGIDWDDPMELLPSDLAECLNRYEFYDISNRKETKKI